jgi:hypothetical protein
VLIEKAAAATNVIAATIGDMDLYDIRHFL